MRILKIVTAISMIAVVIGCSEDRGKNTDSEWVEDGAMPISADDAWRLLFASQVELERAESETDAEFLSRVLEAERTLFRENGLRFWQEFPDDQRRYEWLTITRMMPPRMEVYAYSNLAVISEEGSSGGQNLSEVSAEEYPPVQVELDIDASHRTPQLRLLEFSEIIELVHFIRATEANSIDQEMDLLLALVADYFAKHNEQFNVIDRENSAVFLEALWRIVFETELGEAKFDKQSLLRFLDEIEAVPTVYSTRYDGESRIERMRAFVLEGNKLPDLSERYALREAPDSVRQFWVSEESDNNLVYFKTPSFVTQFVRCHNRLLFYRLHQDAAHRHSSSYVEPIHSNLTHISIQTNPAYYPTDPWGYLTECANSYSAVTETDVASWQNWVTNFELLGESLLSVGGEELDKSSVISRQISRQFELLPYSVTLGTQMDHFRQVVEKLRYLTENGSGINVIASALSRLSRDGEAKFGLPADDVRDVLVEFSDLEVAEYRRVLETYDRRALLESIPFELEAVLLDGTPFNIESLRGKIVLVDHWNTGCIPCIEAMPVIDDVYRAYKNEGFVVVSLAYDATTKRRRVDRIKAELELDDWVSVNAEPIKDDMYEKYDIWTFPQYMLLNRDGTQFAGTEEVALGTNLANLLDEMLAAEN